MLSKLQKRLAFSLGWTALVLGIISSSCARESNSRPMAAGSSSAPIDAFYVALGLDPHVNNADAFKVYAFAPNHDVMADSVRFCLASQDDCLVGRGRVVTALVIELGEDIVFESKTSIELADQLQITILAKSADGVEFATPVTIVEKSNAPRSKTPGSANGTLKTADIEAKQTQSAVTATGTASTLANAPQPNAPQLDGAGCYKAPEDYVCQVELEITRFTNIKRQSAGLPALTYDPKIAYVARLWSQEQAARNAISHEWIQAGVWQQKYMAEFNERPPVNSENVVQGMIFNTPSQTAEALVEMWWNSPQHRANILQTNVTVVGVGFAFGYGGQCYGTQNFGVR